MWVFVLVLAVCAVVVAGVLFYWARPIMTGVVQVRFPAGDTVAVPLNNRRALRQAAGSGTVSVRGLREGTEAKMQVTWTDNGIEDTNIVSRGSSVTMRSVVFRHQEL